MHWRVRDRPVEVDGARQAAQMGTALGTVKKRPTLRIYPIAWMVVKCFFVLLVHRFSIVRFVCRLRI